MMPRFEIRGLREWIYRVLGTVRPSRADDEVAEELRLHLELAADEARRRGHSPEEAYRTARIRVGDPSQALHAVRDQRGLPWLEDLGRDLRYALRSLRRSPTFTTVALLTLVLGIGANTAIYQLLDAVRLRALPVLHPEQLAVVELADLTRWTGRRTTGYPVLSNPLWEEFRDRQTVFSGVLAWSAATLEVRQDSELRPVRALFVNGEFFNVLGVEPFLGRLFTAADDRPGCGVPGAVVSYAFWRTRLGADPAAIGRSITLRSGRVEVIGVTPVDFFGLEVGRAYDIAIPICSHDTFGTERGWLRDGATWWLTVMGRRAPDQSLEIANAQLAAGSRALFKATLPANSSAADRDNYLELKLRAVPGGAGVSALRNQYNDSLLILWVTTGLVLLIACTNLANLVLARASARKREFAVRLAMGASWHRLVRQLMVENGLLALGGAAGGLACARILSRFLTGFLGAGVSLALPLDARVITFVIAVAVLTCLSFGLIPAWRVSRVAAQDALKAGGRSISGGRESTGWRRALVVSQVALSLVLVFGALLFAGTLRNLLAVDAGFQSNAVAVARVNFSQLQIPPARRVSLTRDLLDRIRGVPGVRAAAEVRHVPMGGTGSSIDAWSENAGPEAKTTVRLNAMSDGYLDTMGIRLIAGRDFTMRDTAASPSVAIVNPAFARRLNFRDDPVGQTFRRAGSSSESQVVVEIVGLVPDTKYFTLREDTLPIIFVPISQIDDRRPFTDVMIRSTAPLSDVSSAVRRVVAEIDPLIRSELRTLDSTILDGLLRERLMAALAGLFGGLGALIAAIGLYGMMSYLVLRRTNEIGVRVALGAQPTEIVVMVLREAGILSIVGLAVGSLLAFGAARSAQSLVFGVQPYDIRLLALACALLVAVAIAAGYLPARRAARLRPLAALREE